MTDHLSSVLRAVRAEARREEQNRLVDVLITHALRDSEAAAKFSKRPGVTGQGRRAAHLEYAARLINEEGLNDWATTAGDNYGSVDNACDSIEIYTWDPDPATVPELEEEAMPVRVVVSDGAESVTASAYISLEEADELVALLTEAVAKVRAARADRSSSSP
jgi:hypothetical protein